MISLLAGSFNDVPFLMRSERNTEGPRIAIHEFVNSDSRFVERIGTIPPRFEIQALVHGSNVITLRDSLRNALKNKNQNRLSHPYYGVIDVSVAPYIISTRDTEKGQVLFEMTFLVSDESSFLTELSGSVNNLQSKSRISRTNIGSKYTSLFQPIISSASQDSIELKILGFVTGFTDVLTNSTGSDQIRTNITRDLKNMETNVGFFATNPDEFSDIMITNYDNLSALTTSIDSLNSLTIFGDGDTFISPTTRDRRSRVVNLTLIDDVVQSFSAVGLYEQATARTFETTSELSETSDKINTSFDRVINRSFFA